MVKVNKKNENKTANKFVKGNILSGIGANVQKAMDVKDSEIEKENKVYYIEKTLIDRNQKNFYNISNIEELAEDIEQNGLLHNLVVRKKQNGRYELLSGERRFHALCLLFDKGDKKYAKMPCKVLEKNDIDSEIILIQANAQGRQLSEEEVLEQVERLNELYKLKKKNGEKIPGRIRELIAKNLDVSSTTVGRFERISKKLSPRLKQALERKELLFSNASEFASLSEENQEIIAEIIEQNGKLSNEEGNDLKARIQELNKKKEEEVENYAKDQQEEQGETASLEEVKQKAEINHQKRVKELKEDFRIEDAQIKAYKQQTRSLNAQIVKALDDFSEWDGNVEPVEKQLIELLGHLQCLVDKVEVMLEDCHVQKKEESMA